MASEQNNVGILAMEIHFPPTRLVLEELEAHDEVSKGAYTTDPGQECMGFVIEDEDVVSMSKSIKTFLMRIFEGGTAALLNCVNWVESSSWDGRYGLVVCTDSAIVFVHLFDNFCSQVYAKGPARATGGAAAIAMVVGPDAPIVLESKIRASHMSHVYDIYKPILDSEDPVVDSEISQTCYLKALDSCYKGLCNKYEKVEGEQFSIDNAAYFAFHSPYNKLVQKSFGRLLYNDFLRNASSIDESARQILAPFESLTGDESYQRHDLDEASQQVAKPLYDEKVEPATLIPKQVGNMYTASLYAAFASLLHNKHDTLAGQRVIMFSYGGGSTATMFSLNLTKVNILLVCQTLQLTLLANLAFSLDFMRPEESLASKTTIGVKCLAAFFHQEPTTSEGLIPSTEKLMVKRLPRLNRR
ncbi:hypothetical protein R3W88_021634 [Solanum pinnatisectum]|uniref:Hydroxymethylglutaryl-CoA synthase n=1 Tax=Solanum pinnatisectum TaxID=50273 RepID=A0AAV9LSF4_9SOLN|nr:hypothetical protein R3W88_021634 [Solanum pinnatisectum]